MPYFERGGAKIYFEEAGEGPAVIFSHGLLMDHEMFDPQIDFLKDSFRCVAWDERGHGETVWEGSFTYWDMAEDVLGLMDHLDIGSAFLVGMSQGGFTSLRVALLQAERVLGLALIDTQAGTEEPDKVAVYRSMVDAWVKGENREFLADASADILLGTAERDPWKKKWFSFPPDRIVEPFNTLVEREGLEGRLGDIDAPALVIHGTDDAAIPMDKAEALCAGLPGCEGIIAIEGGSHAANLTHPAEVNSVLLEFLSRHA